MRSPSLRGRGLKCCLRPVVLAGPLVALFTRAWIEIAHRSSPSRGTRVALFTRAWIEILPIPARPAGHRVALFTRAWIEIKGLSRREDHYLVALFTRAWIEISCVSGFRRFRFWSPSLRGRGLKYRPQRKMSRGMSSPSLRGRGLKLTFPASLLPRFRVALFTRAWIEITFSLEYNFFRRSPSLRGRGLKYYIFRISPIQFVSPSLRGRGLKYDKLQYNRIKQGRPLYEGVD